jgi:gamma-glutamyltranspeptidase/glutathione hydrolase
LRNIARNGAKAFYEGQIASDLVAYLTSLGGLHQMSDFAGHAGEYVEPISTAFHGQTVLECPPNGQGLTALIILNLLQEVASDTSMDSVSGIHLLAEASKLAYSIRDGVIADPTMSGIDVDHCLSRETTTRLASRIDPRRASPRLALEQLMPEHPDTSYVTVVDRNRMVVSLIASIFSDFGSTLVEPRSGMLLQNRGMGFNLIAGHPNCVAPKKRPMHTIIPGLVMKDGRATFSFGVVGGHYQPVGHAQLLHAIFAEGLDVQAALNLPRSLCIDGILQLESSQREERLAALYALGHAVAAPPHPLGGGHGIYIDDRRGILIGGTDSRRDGIVAGY